VEKSNCGEELPCPHCGRLVQVPSLRELKTYPLAEQPLAAQRNETPAAAGGGGQVVALAVVGSLTTLATLAIVFLVMVRMLTISDFSAEDDIYLSSRKLDEMSAEATWGVWTEFRKTGLGEQELPPYALDQRRLRVVNIALALSVVAAVAGLSLCVALVLQPPPRRRGPMQC